MPRGRGPGKGNSGKAAKRAIDRYEHVDKKRVNNPPVGSVKPETDQVAADPKSYEYQLLVLSVRPGKDLAYDPHLSPKLVWAGKKEHTLFQVPTDVQDQIGPRTIIEAVRKPNSNGNQYSRLFSNSRKKCCRCRARRISKARAPLAASFNS